MRVRLYEEWNLVLILPRVAYVSQLLHLGSSQDSMSAHARVCVNWIMTIFRFIGSVCVSELISCPKIMRVRAILVCAETAVNYSIKRFWGLVQYRLIVHSMDTFYPTRITFSHNLCHHKVSKSNSLTDYWKKGGFLSLSIISQDSVYSQNKQFVFDPYYKN